MQKILSKHIKIVALSVLFLVGILSVVGAFFAMQVGTNYSMDQFLPKKHSLLTWDQESKKLFHIFDTSPYIVLLSLDKSSKNFWYSPRELTQLQILTEEIAKLEGVRSVVSLGNIQSSFEQKNELLVSNLGDLQKRGFDVRSILNDPLYTPNLISKDGLHTALFVTPLELSQENHKLFLDKLERLAIDTAHGARVQIGGPAAIRTQFVDLLSHEIMLFIILSLFCAIIVVKIMFHGLNVLPQILFILIAANTFALGMMGIMHLSLNVLSSTLPIIVTITALGISAHTLVRMGEGAHLPFAERVSFLKRLMRELTLPHLLTAATTSLGFATLMTSHVPLIADYGKVVFFGVLIAAVTTLVTLPSLYVWFRWPAPRDFLNDSKRFSFFLVGNASWLTPVIGILVIVFFGIGSRLSWTARLFDDLPMNHSARMSTDLVSTKLGGVATVDFVVGGETAVDPWKQPENIEKLKNLSQGWRKDKQVGSVLTLADFLATGKNKVSLPAKREGIAELELLYSMSGESPLEQFLSFNEKWTRIALRLPDLPSDQNRKVIDSMQAQIQSAFPVMEVKVAGLAAVVPTINDELSSELMWGFFASLFWIVLLLALVFRSLRWALVAVIPNLVPPTLLLGFLAMFHVPIKPGIAIIFSISLGLAFCNTVYVLERLKYILKSGTRKLTLPIYALMKKETMPCLVSSLSLFGGFSIFLFSVFPMNKLFGVFMLASIAAGLLGDLVWLPAMLKRFPWLLLENLEEGLDHLPMKWKALAKIGPYVVLLALGIVAFHSVYASL
ncbi:MAG: efflux RND transporter permease subunit [Bdellovibrionales bacterium]